jgi:hypothetical protein
MEDDSTTRPEAPEVAKINGVTEGRSCGQLERMAAQSIVGVLNLFCAQARWRGGAVRNQYSRGRAVTRAGSYTHKLQTKSGEVVLKVPKLRPYPSRARSFRAAIGARAESKRREWKCIWPEFWCAGADYATDGLRATQVKSAVVKLNKKIYVQIKRRCNVSDTGKHSYFYPHKILMKWICHSFKNVSVLIAIGVNQAGFRHGN